MKKAALSAIPAGCIQVYKKGISPVQAGCRMMYKVGIYYDAPIRAI
jgi:hypothetical protein